MPRRHSNSIQVPFFPTSWKHVREPSLWLEELSFDVTRATEWWKLYHVNGNVTAEFDRAPRGSFSSDIGDSEADPKFRWTVHTSVRRDLYDFPHPLSSFSSSSSVRKPNGGQLVTRRPCVSTREYGGWVCTGERGGDGDVPEMVKERQTDASPLMKCPNSSLSGRCPEAASSLKSCACTRL